MPFIVFEGLDGSGKSTLMGKLEEFLLDRKLPVLRTREPGGTALGDEIKELILRKNNESPTARTELLLYEAIRAQHVDCVLKPHLQRQYWVLCDRFKASSLAFQAGGRQISIDWVEKLNEFATENLEPDLTVLLDLSVEESRKRRERRVESSGFHQDRIESEADSFHQRVRMAFLEQAKAKKEKWLVLDASQTSEALAQELFSYLKGCSWLESQIK